MLLKPIQQHATHHFNVFLRELSTRSHDTLHNKVWKSPETNVKATQRVFSKQLSETAEKVIGCISGATGILMLCALNEKQSQEKLQHLEKSRQEKLQHLAKCNGAILRDIDGGRASGGDV